MSDCYCQSEKKEVTCTGCRQGHFGSCYLQWVMPAEAKVPVEGKEKNMQSNKAIIASY